ncbi:MAG: fibronectin type III domain-containing protein [Cytophagales bacterium]|nr:fibronectin type III domain-containing protein [Cytophagales bacterium]
MKLPAKLALVLTVLTSFYTQSNAQIDTTWTLFHYRNNGTRAAGFGSGGTFFNVDIRLRDNDIGTWRDYYLVENKTFSFRKANGLPTDTYFGMAGFTSTNYTQGQLRANTAWHDKFSMNYRLIKPKNYGTAPNVAGGYPLIVMIHGLGERGNAGYWSNGNWNPNDNNPQAGTYRIISAASVAGGTRFTTQEAHGFTNNLQVTISNSSVPGYNGNRTVTDVSNVPPYGFTVSGLNYTNTATADVFRPTMLQLLNNDHNLLHGGSIHQTAVLLPGIGSKVPDDPTMPARAFPGFVLFPQNISGWQEPNGAENVVRIIRLLIKKYNINPNKIYLHGLSDGGAGAYRVMRTAPWLFSAILPMSAVNDADIRSYNLYPYMVNIPQWIFQGGTDGNPTPSQTQTRIQDFRNNGMDIRYTLYPSLGHGVWNNAYNEPDFFTWMRKEDKSNIYVKFGNQTVCGTNGTAAELLLSQGFLAYQWEKDGAIIPGANTYSYSATLPGTYRARFSRKANPTESDWNRWSDPMVITESAPPTPVIKTIGSPVMPTINPAVYPVVPDLVLKSSEKNEKYYWYQNGALVTNARTYNNQNTFIQDTLSMIYRSFEHPGSYTVRTATVSACPSLLSAPLVITHNTPTTITLPSNFSGTAQSPTSIFLTWADNSPNETGFEIWRRISGETIFTYVAVTEEDAISYLDTHLTPGTLYEYKLRAVSNTARSLHVPSEDPDINLEVETPLDEAVPSTPQNLRVVNNTINNNSISLAWDASTDNGGINQYVVTYGSTPVSTFSTETTFTITGLALNQAYPITVQAQDFGGNLSTPSNMVIGTTVVEGLYYEHSTGAWSSLNPATSATNLDTPPIDWITAEFTGRWPDFNVNPVNVEWGTPGFATQEDFYKIKFDGYLLIPPRTSLTPNTHSSDTYQFRIISDDRSRLYLGGFNPNNFGQNNLLDHNTWTEGYVYKTTGNIGLPAAPYRITVLYNEFTESQSLSVEYRRRTLPNSPTTWSDWAPIPPGWLRSMNYTPPATLAAPASLVATANGMTNIDLTWVYGLPAHEFEVYRATVIDGEYTIVGRATGSPFTDDTANPSTTYFYKLKTINVTNGASSPFSTVASATTASDALAPSIPTDVTFISKTFSNVAFSWSASTDNVAVTGYEVLANGNPVGVSTVTSYSATDLEPGTLYNFTVKAFDAIGNKSVASDPLAVTTNAGVMYYSKPAGALYLATTWGTNTDGTGTVPNLTYNGQYYMVANRASTGLGGNPLTIGGSISKLIVPTGTTLTVDNTISAKLEVQGNAVVNLNNATTAPEFLSVSPTSTVNFNNYAYIPAGTYGHVSLTGTGNKNFAEGETVIMGNLNATTGIALKGVSGNASQVTVHGDITLAGTPGVVATDNALDLTLAKAGTQTLTVNGALDLYKLSTNSGTNVNVVSSSPITLNVGSPNGGGLVLANGTTLNLGNNHLVMKNAANINAGGQTGKLAINGSNLTLSSSSAQNSNLHFDATLKTAGLVTSTFSSTGKLMVQSPVNITDGLKIKAGEVSSAGNITLVSTENKTAYLQELEGNGSITGNAKVERWVSAVRKYRYMSSSVANMTVAMWQTYMPITGNFTGANTNASVASMFYYVENDGGYKNYPATGGNNTVTFQRGRGYSIFNYNGNNPLTLTMTGNPYQGSVPFTLTPAGGANAGWNLVGNPYASAIQWNNLASDWTRTGVSTAIAVPDNATGTLVQRTYDSQTGLGTLTGGIIAPGQAFWVQTTGAATMTVHEKAKRTNTSTFYREGDTQLNSITIRLSNGTTEDVGYVILGENFSDVYEPETDGLKYKNQVLNVSTRSSENVNLVFNKMSDSFCEKTVAIVLEDVTPGQYTLAFDNIENLVGVGAVALTDHFTNTTVAITNSTPYSFAVTAAAASFGTARFSLTLNRPALQKNAIASVENVCGGTSATIQLTNTQPGVFYYATRVNEATPISEIVADETGTQLTIPVSALQAGANSVVIHTGFKGCSDELLTTTPLVFNYTPSPLVAVEKPFLSLCAESQINLKAETNSANSLHWYKDGVLIANQTSASWISDPLKKTTLFEVAAVSNGCEGPKTSVYVEINRVEMPLVEFTGKNLEIVNDIPADNFIQWYVNNSPLDAYDRVITPTEEGIYTALVAKGGCSVVSEPFEYLVTGVENPFNEPFNAYVYPNPATFDQLYVKLETPSKQNATVTLVDLTGRTVFTQAINGAEGNGVHKLNVEQDTTPGLYIVQIQQGSAVLQRKVILQFK